MKAKLLIALAMLAALSGVSIPIVKTHSRAISDQLSTNEALSLVRTLSTIEAEKKEPGQSFIEGRWFGIALR